jgi:hypothetical protein
MIPASYEQQQIVQKIANHDLIVDSVAGSGKTTTVLHIASAYKDMRVMLLTYNTKLRHETNARAADAGIENLFAHTFHSFAVKYIHGSCYTDDALLRHIEQPLKLRMPRTHILVVDEAQDMTEIYYRVVLRILDELPTRPWLAVIGDKNQSIYQFNGADMRFITLADAIFADRPNGKKQIDDKCATTQKVDETKTHSAEQVKKVDETKTHSAEQVKKVDETKAHPTNQTENTETVEKVGDTKSHSAAQVGDARTWLRLNLSTSYRLTSAMAKFINECMLGEPRLIALKTGPKVEYHYIGYDVKPVYYIIQSLLDGGVPPASIFVLAPSVRSSNARNPIRMLSNLLSERGHAIYVPMNDEVKLSEELLANKLVFSSFHQAKGLERDYVFVMGFDASYYQFYNRSAPTDSCPNELYVACTRAKKQLFVFQSKDKPAFSWLQGDKLHATARVVGQPREGKLNAWTPHKTNVIELVRHQPVKVVSAAMECLTRKRLRSPGQLLDIPIQVRQRFARQVQDSPIELLEDVSDINGVAIPAYYEYLNSGATSITKRVPPWTGRESTHPEQLLKCANEYLCVESGYHYKLRQITDYSWMSHAQLKTACKRIDSILKDKNTHFELPVGGSVCDKRINGRIDAECRVSDDRREIYEFKYTNELSPDHYLQLAVYAAMYAQQHPAEAVKSKFFLYNIKSGEKVQLLLSGCARATQMLICSKFHRKATVDDGEFLSALGSETELQPCTECGMDWTRGE